MTQAGTSFYSRQTYFSYGAQRTTEGSALPTDNTFTGQKSDDSTGLMFYNARYYDTSLGRFTQPDTIVPNPLNPQSLNRFAYVLNNPLKYTDPTGHYECWDEGCSPGDPEGDGQEDETSAAPPAENPCNSDPTAEGCPGAQEAVPPAETGENQGQADSDDSCHSAARKCDGDYDPETDEQSPGISPAAIYINDYDLDGHRIFRAFAWFDSHPGYVPLNDPYFERIQGDLSQDYWKWDMEKLAAANPNPADLFLAFGMGMAAIGGKPSSVTLPGNVTIDGMVNRGAKTLTVQGSATDLFSKMTANGTPRNLPSTYTNGLSVVDVEGGSIGLRMSEKHGLTIDLMNYEGYEFTRIHFK